MSQKVLVGVKMPVSLHEKVLARAALDTQRTGYNINKTDVIVKILEEALKGDTDEKVSVYPTSLLNRK